MNPRILTLSSFARLPEPQHVMRMLICNCCSARRLAVWKQQSQTPSCFSQGSRRTGWPEQRSDSARLRLGPNKDALAAIRDPRVTAFEPPGGLAVRAAILALNGYEEGARNDAQILGAKLLLLEERALIAPLL